MTNNLTEQIWDSIKYERNSDGKVITKKHRSINLPEINLKATKAAISSVVKEYTKKYSAPDIYKLIKESVNEVKDQYVETHDGFRIAKGIAKDKRLTVGEIYAFAQTAGYLFEFLPKTTELQNNRIGIGVMAPASQDTGKNLIKLFWETTGNKIHDLGTNVKPQVWLDAIEKFNLSVLGVSCMITGCEDKLIALLSAIKESDRKISICIGGMAADRALAYELYQEFGIPVFWGKDVGDAENVLSKAIHYDPIEIPTIRRVEKAHIPTNVTQTIHGQTIRAYQFPIAKIVINENSRAGCETCEGEKKENCPLENGYEKQRELSESKKFVEQYQFAVLINTNLFPYDDRIFNKKIWEQLLKIEQYFSIKNNSAYAFRYPMSCPHCPPKNCTLAKGKCMFPAYYRPVHETYSINLSDTFKNVLGEDGLSGMSALILVK